MDTALVVAIVAIALEILVVAVGAVWVVGRISAVTDVLRESIDHLKESVDGLRNSHISHDERLRKTEERLAAIRARQNDPMTQS